MGSYDNGVYQPIFSVIAKSANMEQKEAFIRWWKIRSGIWRRTALIKNRSVPALITMNSVSARRISAAIRGA